MEGHLRPASDDAALDMCLDEDFTRTSAAEETLRALAVEWLPAAVVATDLSTRIVYANPAFRELWQCSPRQQLAGRTLADICGQPMSFLHAVAQTGEACMGEIQVRDPDNGGQRWMSYHAVRVQAMKDQPVCLLVSFSPAGKSRSALNEAVRSASEDQQISVRPPHMAAWNIELSSGSASLQGPAQWTDGMFALLGYRPGDIPTATVNYLHAVHPEDRERVKEELETSIASGTAIRSLHKIRQANGTIRQIAMESSVSRDPVSGEPARLLCSLQDVTDYAVLRRKLENKGQLLRGMMEGFDHPIYSVDRELRYTSFNSAHTHMRDQLWSSPAVLGADVLSGILSMSDRRTIRNGLQQALGGVRHVEEVTHESQAGSACRYEMEYLPIEDATGCIIGVAVFGKELRNW